MIVTLADLAASLTLQWFGSSPSENVAVKVIDVFLGMYFSSLVGLIIK